MQVNKTRSCSLEDVSSTRLRISRKHWSNPIWLIYSTLGLNKSEENSTVSKVCCRWKHTYFFQFLIFHLPSSYLSDGYISKKPINRNLIAMLSKPSLSKILLYMYQHSWSGNCIGDNFLCYVFRLCEPQRSKLGKLVQMNLAPRG